MPIARRLAVGDAKGVDELRRAQPQQFASRGGGAEDADKRGAVPAAIPRGGEGQATGDVETQGDGEDEVAAADAAEALGCGEAGEQRRGSRMDTAAVVEGVIEVERMAHGGVDQRGLGRGDAVAE